MLTIVMHNRQDYLASLISLAKKNDIADAKIIDKKDIGVRLIGESANFVFHKGNLLTAYDKAFVAVIRDEKKVKRLLDLIENDAELNLLNLEDKGFICTLPFDSLGS